MNPTIFKAIHLIAFTCIVGFVVLAKTMFMHRRALSQRGREPDVADRVESLLELI